MGTTVTAQFVTFFSPGTFVSETTTLQIEAWNVDTAKQMARTIEERHGALPYGFQFTTRERGPEDLDSKQTAQSPMYYLSGKVETLAEVKARATDKDRILIANMEGNRIERVITNDNSWRYTAPLNDSDIILDWDKPAQEVK